MGKLPTTFTSLDLQGFEINKTQQYTNINREMVDLACAVLQKNRVGIVTRSVQAALKIIYGIGGATDTVCQFLSQWRSENLAALKQGKEKDLISAIIESTDDGLLEEADIPEDYLSVMRRMAIAGYSLAFQKADTTVSGDRMKQLTLENDLLSRQLKDFPQLQLELDFYKSEYERQRNELKEAYLNLNKQQLADSNEFRSKLDSLTSERNDLAVKLEMAEKALSDFSELETKERDRMGEISRLNGQLEAREREISSLHSQTQSLMASVGEKQVLEAQLTELKSQLKSANETITNLLSKQKSTHALEVDVDIDALVAEKDTLRAEKEALITEKETLNALVKKLESIAIETKTSVSETLSL
jgi:chromosome segregation ATPase